MDKLLLRISFPPVSAAAVLIAFVAPGDRIRAAGVFVICCSNFGEDNNCSFAAGVFVVFASLLTATACMTGVITTFCRIVPKVVSGGLESVVLSVSKRLLTTAPDIYHRWR